MPPAGGLLSSSCCVLQLLLNWASIGCVGFSALTPYRGAFRGLTGALLAYLLYSQGLNRHSVATLLLSTALMVSQDVVAVHNRGEALPRSVQDALQRARWRQHGRQQQPPAATRTQLAVTGLRCEACAARLRRSLAAVPGVDGCTVAFNEGLVEVWSNRSQPVGVAELRDAVAATDSSYSVTDVSRVCFDASEQRQPCGAERHAAVQHSEAAAAGSSAADGKQEL
jgi:copper chaperone CopZ